MCVCKYYNVLNRSINVFWLVQDRSIRLAMYVMYNRFENIFTETHFPQQAILSFTKYLPDSKPNKVHFIF